MLILFNPTVLPRLIDLGKYRRELGNIYVLSKRLQRFHIKYVSYTDWYATLNIFTPERRPKRYLSSFIFRKFSKIMFQVFQTLNCHTQTFIYVFSKSINYHF